MFNFWLAKKKNTNTYEIVFSNQRKKERIAKIGVTSCQTKAEQEIWLQRSQPNVDRLFYRKKSNSVFARKRQSSCRVKSEAGRNSCKRALHQIWR